MEVGKLRNKIELAIPVPNRSGNPIEIINEIKNTEKGVYAFYSGENELLYIGKTTDLKSRIFSHISGQSRNTKDIYHLFDRLKIWIFDNEADIDIFETYLINRLKPKYNVAKTFYKKEEKNIDMSNVLLSEYDIGYNLQRFRESKGLTQKQMADLLRISKTTYSNYESNRTEMPVRLLVLSADFFNVSIDELIGRELYFDDK